MVLLAVTISTAELKHHVLVIARTHTTPALGTQIRLWLHVLFLTRQMMFLNGPYSSLHDDFLSLSIGKTQARDRQLEQRLKRTADLMFAIDASPSHLAL